jgi:hypothetical protein
MKKLFIFSASFLACVPAVAQANANSELRINLTANVDVFCHIYPPADDEVHVQDGHAVIGQVREICNTPNGYDVTTSFTNLTSGELDVGDGAYRISDGFATRTTSRPSAQTLTWQIAGAQVAQADLPVLMRVVISPR